MAYKSIILAALISIAAAIPQHAEHLGSAQIARSNGVLARTDLEGRTISYDGSCGSWSGYICGNGGCCSSQGWCGSTEAHCGVGCQEGFGQCSSGNDPAPIQSSSEIIPAPSTQVVEPTITSTTQAVQPPVVQTTQAPSPTHTTAALPPVIVSTDLPSFQTAGAGQAPAGPHTTIAFEPHTTVVPVQQTTTLAIPVTTSNPSSGLGDAYKMYLGDGSLAAGWPAQSEWLDFDTAFENNRGLMSQSCTQFGAANNNNDEIDSLKASLQSVASSTGVDARFLLAIMMQESGGCVRAPTTNYGVRNPGLFQSHNGAGSCNDGSSLSPCPASEITQMVTDGAAGTPSGDGLKQTIAEAATSDVSKYYRAARIYNSGSIAASGQLQDGIATHCYSADVANRLTGWVHAAHGCSLS